MADLIFEAVADFIGWLLTPTRLGLALVLIALALIVVFVWIPALA